MKYIYPILSIFLLPVSLFSQEEFITDFTWYLTEFQYEGTNYEIPGHSPDVPVSLAFFENGNQTELNTAITVDSFFSFVEIDDSNYTITTSEPSITLFGCSNYCDLESAYFDFFFKDGSDITFDYELIIIDNEPGYILYIIDEFGNYAYYSETPLNVNENQLFDFTIYPNPATDELVIGSKLPLDSIEIFDANGRTLYMQNDSSKRIDVSKLSKGIYFIVVTLEGKRWIHKFIKN